MVCIREATLDDLLQMQRTNLLCLPENYTVRRRRPRRRRRRPAADARLQRRTA